MSVSNHDVPISRLRATTGVWSVFVSETYLNDPFQKIETREGYSWSEYGDWPGRHCIVELISTHIEHISLFGAFNELSC